MLPACLPAWRVRRAGGAPLLANVSQHKEGLRKVLAQIPEMFAGTRVVESCGGAALEVRPTRAPGQRCVP